jgi:hypothetical protein
VTASESRSLGDCSSPGLCTDCCVGEDHAPCSLGFYVSLCNSSLTELFMVRETCTSIEIHVAEGSHVGAEWEHGIGACGDNSA